MNFIPHPLVQPGPSKKQIGRKLAKVIATMRKRLPATTPKENISPTTTL